MRQRVTKPSYYLLSFLALLSLFLFFLAEGSQTPRKRSYYDQKIKAAQLARRAQEIIKHEIVSRGYVIDVQNDPNLTGLIGPQYSLITTDRGYIRDKLISTNPNCAAVLIDLFHRAKLKPGDLVAVTFTGSFPAMNIAVLSVCEVMGLKPVIISSIGAATWGATWDEFSWLDIESALVNNGIWTYKSIAASLGGGNDHGRGLSPKGRELLIESIKRNNVELISSISEENPSGSLEANIEKRIEIFDREKGEKEYKGFVNVGGGLAAVGSSQNGRLIPPGYNRSLYDREFPARGVINILAERRIPVIHLLQLDRFAEKYGLPVEVSPEPEIGEGPVYVREQFSIVSTFIYTIILMIVLIGAIRIDLRYYIYKNKHLFVRK
jgi:poly-gamma-glutamate system protein